MRQHLDQDDNHFYSESTDDYEIGPMDPAHIKEVRRKLDERMERRRLKEELEDYEGELDNDFEWDGFSDK
ncbi:MAG: hypothetical protein CK424_00225 [Legionella sp.]|nr:MAG: hypothetical protein CK424_00225 [Legionella sp.]